MLQNLSCNDIFLNATIEVFFKMIRLNITAVVILFTALTSSTVHEGQRGAFNAWERLRIVRDAIDVAPSQKLSISYKTGSLVNFGNVLTPTQVREYPRFSWNANPTRLYALAFVDLDDWSSEKQTKHVILGLHFYMSKYLHYLVGNIPGSDISTGSVLANFMGSGPLQGSGLHRYVFLIYGQSRKLSFGERPLLLAGGSIADRECFSIRNFTRKYFLGKPVAGNFYLSQWDETVPKLYAEWDALSKLKPNIAN